MLVNLINERVPKAILLADPILIELGVLTAKFVGRSLTVVCSEVVYKAREHVLVLLARANGWHKDRSQAFMQPSCGG